jgi:hypothetical protein
VEKAIALRHESKMKVWTTANCRKQQEQVQRSVVLLCYAEECFVFS